MFKLLAILALATPFTLAQSIGVTTFSNDDCTGATTQNQTPTNQCSVTSGPFRSFQMSAGNTVEGCYLRVYGGNSCGSSYNSFEVVGANPADCRQPADPDNGQPRSAQAFMLVC